MRSCPHSSSRAKPSTSPSIPSPTRKVFAADRCWSRRCTDSTDRSTRLLRETHRQRFRCRGQQTLEASRSTCQARVASQRATVERAVASQITQGDSIILNLNDPDFTTATRLVASVNKAWAMASPPSWMAAPCVCAAARYHAAVAFLSTVENLEVEPGAASAKVIITRHRYRGDQQSCHRDTRSRLAWLVVGNDQRRAT